MASTTDLTNPIHLPNGIDTANNNPIARSDKVIRQGKGHNVETGLTRLENAIINWNMNTAVTDRSDPGLGNIAFNAATRTATTFIGIHAQSNFNNLRVDEILADLETNDKLILQEAENPDRAVIFELTGAAVSQGSYYELPVVERRVQGLEFTNGNKINAWIITASQSGGSLTADQQSWLGQVSLQSIQSTAVTNIAPIVTDILIWRRAAIVTQSGINDPGTGLRIDDANRQSDGTFDRQSGTAVYDDDLANAYIYIGITDSDFTGIITPSETFLEIRRGGVLVFSASLSNLTTPVVVSGQFTYRRTTNNQYHYVAGDTMEVVTRAVSTSTEYNYSNLGDFTVTVKDLPFSALGADLAGRVVGPSSNQGLTAADRVKLIGLLVNTTVTGSQNLTVLYKEGVPTGTVSDYSETWSPTNTVLPEFSTSRVVSILVDNNVSVTSVTNGGTLGPQLLWIPGRYIYQVTLPPEAGTGTPTEHIVVGTVETFLPTGFNDNYKIQRNNVEQNLLNQIDAHGNNADISSLETKVDALFPLTPDVDILINWANIYDPIHGAATVDITNGYSLIADYRSTAQRYESAGLVFGTGTDVVTYTGLTENLHRSFGFVVPRTETITLTGTSGTANINIDNLTDAASGVNYLVTFTTDLTVTASDFVSTHAVALNTAGIVVTSNGAVLTFTAVIPNTDFIVFLTNETGNLAGSLVTVAADKTLMWIVDGGTNIPFVDVTAAGNIRVNNFTPEETTATNVSNQFHFLTKQSGPATISEGVGNQRFALTNFPAGATNASRTMQIDIEVFVNGVNTQAAHEQAIDAPDLNTAQALQTFDASVFLGPLHGNRTVDVTVGYEFIVDGADLDIRLTLVTAPSDVSVNFEGSTAVLLSYTAQNTVARVDNFLNLNGLLGDYTFTGYQEFILSMRPTIGTNGEQTGYLEVVPGAVGTSGIISQLNDTDIRIPTPLWTDIQVADDIGFKTFAADHYFVHSEVAGLLRHKGEQWAYGLARLQTINAGHSLTQAIDLQAGSTIGGSPIGPGTVQEEEVVYEAQNKTTGANGLVSSVVLPADYATYKYIHVTEYDTSSLQFRHTEMPTYIFDAGLVDVNDNVRLQGNTVMQWTAGTRTLAMNPVAQEILRVTLKD